MVGTDERDLFIPLVNREIHRAFTKKHDIKIFDIGGGDGETATNYALRSLHNFTLDVLEPNEKYLEQYSKLFGERFPRSSQGKLIADDINNFILQSSLKREISIYDLILCIHSLYFAEDLKTTLNFMLDSLSYEGSLVIILADEIRGYTGQLVQRYYQLCAPNKLESFLKKAHQRDTLFSIKNDKTEEDLNYHIEHFLRRSDFSIVAAEYQDSRLYGYNLSDLVALGFITALSYESETPIENRIDIVLDTLTSTPESFSLSLENDKIRPWMLSVSEPQICFVLQKRNRKNDHL